MALQSIFTVRQRQGPAARWAMSLGFSPRAERLTASVAVASASQEWADEMDAACPDLRDHPGQDRARLRHDRRVSQGRGADARRVHTRLQRLALLGRGQSEDSQYPDSQKFNWRRD